MRLRPFGLLVAGVIVTSSGCSTDATIATGPSSPSYRRVDAQAIGLAHAPMGGVGDGARPAEAGRPAYTVTIDPLVTNRLYFGRHTLLIPARAICDQAGGYGIGAWDDSCRAERHAVTITALVRSTDHGIPRIDFSPELRFSPKQVVVLTMHVPNLGPALPIANILYCASQSTEACVDEAATDPELQTYRNYPESSVFRRIKHFSGYFVQE